ncbi:SCP2 sterol-binding domain-containing protein [Oxalobacteraceae bacterium R-40]|uniref:Ubiquinone biosynthesis accessory factor UbiT n=1 Tax=Keguizhuia sedimenti TaxID=3064264 RepID=A0ABU1BQB7_9BURK|nr:SCP2 sterol-binding domain-containing protein [Oxalobacteraceae bacterium R-40]
MSNSAYHIPRPIGRLLSMLPAYPGSVLFAQGLNATLSKLLPDDLRVSLRNKKIRINATDAHIAFDFIWDGNRFAACNRQAHPDLTISASAYDFLRLAKRQEDPDTLFFSRRLLMEGDTELALAVKNSLDAVDMPIFPFEKLVPPKLLQSVRHKMEQAGRRTRSADY